MHMVIITTLCNYLIMPPIGGQCALLISVQFEHCIFREIAMCMLAATTVLQSAVLHTLSSTENVQYIVSER